MMRGKLPNGFAVENPKISVKLRPRVHTSIRTFSCSGMSIVEMTWQRNFKLVSYSLIGAATVGVGLNLMLNLDKTIVLPFFPDVLDTAVIIASGTLLLCKVIREAR